MTIAEEKQYWEWLRFRLFKSVFKGTDNRGTRRGIEKCFQELQKLHELERNKKRKK